MEETRFKSRGWHWAAAAVLVLAVFASYQNSFSGAFVFDDTAAIADNPTIRHLGDWRAVLSPPNDAGQTVGGRPLVNFTLALNYAVGGAASRGYHIVNVAIHALAALALFGVARRTLLRTRFAASALMLAFWIGLLWAVHPLLTESVTYTVQRAESLMGLLYLLTLYSFIRGIDCHPLDDKVKLPSEGEKPVCHPLDDNRQLQSAGGWWWSFSLVTCLLGMATKEVMATAPLVVLLYDRTFVAGAFRDALRARWKFYASLAATWLLLGWLVLGAANRGGTAGLGAGDSWWTYALTQARAITHYLRLAIWPRPLVFDYGTAQIENLAGALPFIGILVILLGTTIVALRRWPAVGFLGAWVFIILAPSSSVLPIAVQPMAEHRMYLPLAGIVTLLVLALHASLRRASGWVGAGFAVGMIMATISRNADYRSATALWTDTVEKAPANARAHGQLAEALAADGRLDEALAQFEEAIRLEQSAATDGRSLLGELHINHGNALLGAGRNDEAIRAYEAALRFNPSLKLAHYNLGSVLLELNRLPEAAEHFAAALKVDPAYGSAHTNFGSLLLRQNRPADALVHYDAVLRLAPSAKAHTNVGIALLAMGRTGEALAHFEAALRLDSHFTAAQDYLVQTRAAQLKGLK